MSRKTELNRLRLILGLGSVVVVLTVLSAVFGTDGLLRHRKLKHQIQELRKLNYRLAAQNDELEYEAWALRHHSAFTERVIRDELGWVRPDELLFLFSADTSRN